MNLIDDALKNEIASAMANVFDTFARSEQVTFYKMPNSEVLAYDPNFNGGFQSIDSLSSVTNSAVSESFTCRVIYLDRQDYSSFVEGGEDVGVSGKFLYNRIKLQMKVDAFEYLKDTERFIFSDEKYAIEESWKKLGILGTFQFYQIVLKRVV